MKQKSLVLARTATAFLLGSVLFAAFGVYFFLEKQSLWGWISIACTLFFLIAAAFVPLFYVVDKNGIRIRYFTGDKENYEWKNVQRVCAEYDSLIPYFFDTYRIDGDDYTVYMFYKEGRLERSARLAALIKQYSGKEVEGLIPDGLTGGAARRFKLSYGKAVDASAAQAAERGARKLVRSAISALGDVAAALSCEYVYTTADGESDKRPSVDYTYSLVLKNGKDTLATVKLLAIKRGAKAMKVVLDSDGEYIKSEIQKYI